MQLHLYYGPGVKTMSESWPAWLFGAYDPELSITFDKVPGPFWAQAVSARVFGYSSWSVLLPSLLASVIAILLLYRVVQRWAGPFAAIVAAAAYATTPIVAALARTQIPDPLLVVLLLAAAVAWQRALANARLAPLLWTGLWVGLAFQAKMAQAWLVWIPLGAAYLMLGPGGWGPRAARLAAGGVVTAAVSSVWVVAMALTPSSARPWIDGSLDDSVWSMVFGYNGLNRYGVDNAGAEVLGVGGPLGRSEGSAWLYLFRDGVAPQIGWLYPLALAGVIAGLWAGDRVRRANCLMWTLWLGVHLVAFAISLKPHTFYNVLLAPALAALAGAGLSGLWAAYLAGGWRRWVLPAAVAVTVGWESWVASRFAFAPWLPTTVAVAGGIAVAGLLLATLANRGAGRTLSAAVAGGVAAILVAPIVWTLSVTDNLSVSDAHRPAAGPASREIASILSGRLERMLPGAELDRIAGRVKAETHGERYQLAVQWSPQAGQFLLRDVSVLPVGGFTAQIPNISPAELDDLVREQQLAFALVDGLTMKGKPTPDYPDYADWVRQRCTTVAEFDQPLYTLYDCRGTGGA